MQEGQPIQDLPTPLLYHLTLHALGLVDVPAYSAKPKVDIERRGLRMQAAHRAPSLFERARGHNLRDEDYLLGTWQVEVGQKCENVLTGKGDDANM
jgi:hypothetical protein